MRYYSHWGFNDFVLCVGYKSGIIKDFFLNYKNYSSDFTVSFKNGGTTIYHKSSEDLDWTVTIAETGLEAMTGARIRKVRHYVEDCESFMLTYGDGLGDIDLLALKAFHQSHGKILTVTGVRPPGRFGELMSELGVVSEFNEKPQATGGRISGGFFVARQELFNYLPGGDSLVFEQEPMKCLVVDKELMMYDHDGFWQPMDTYREFKLLNELNEQKKAPWIKWS